MLAAPFNTMKKFILVFGFFTLASALGLRAYFALVPPPEATLLTPIAQIVPDTLEGWSIKDMDMADSPESSARISDFLNFDDALFRVFQKDDTFVGLYIAYWTPGKASYRWAGSHTPDTCWVVNGWTRNEREYSIPFTVKEKAFEPAEFGIYEKDGNAQQVYFWHLIGGEAFSYKQKGRTYFLNALVDIKAHGFNLRQEQFFVRLSSNKTLEELKKMEGFNDILDSMLELGMQIKPQAEPAH